MFDTPLIAQPLWNLVDAAGAGGLSTPAPADPAIDGQAAPVTPDPAATLVAPVAPSAPSAYVPDGLPDDFKGATDQETIDKLWKAHAERPKPPEAPDAYKLDLESPELKGVIAPDDRVADAYRKIALEEGLTQQQFAGTITKLATYMKAEGLIAEPMDIDAEFAALSDGRGDKAAQIQAGKQATLQIVDAIKGLEGRQMLDAELATELVENVLVSAKSVKAVNALLKLLPDSVTGPRATGAASGASAEVIPLEQRMYPSMFKQTGA